MAQTVIYFSKLPVKDNAFADLLIRELQDFKVVRVGDETEFPRAVKLNKPDIIIIDPGLTVVYEPIINAVIKEHSTIPLLFATSPKSKQELYGRKSDPETQIFFTALKNHLAVLKTRDIAKVTKKLNEAEDRFFQAFYHSPLPMMIVRASDNIIIETNEQILKSLNCPFGGLIGDDATGLDTSGDGSRPTEFQNLLNTTRLVRNFPMKIRKHTGEIIDCIVFAEAMNVSNLLCYLFIFFDLTELKMA